MKAAELKGLSVEDLQQRLVAEQEALVRLRFAHAISPVENPTRLKNMRRNVARLKTIIHEKKNEA